MKMKNAWKALIAILVLLCVFSMAITETSGIAPEEQGEPKRILVIETTDIHGYIMDASSGKEETFQYRLAYIAHLINEARASGEYDDVLLLDGGDLYQGTPVSNLTGGAAIRAALDVMDYDAIALGNHEFDWEVTEYAADQDGTIAPYVLGDYFGDEKTPILASNLYDAATGERVPFTQDYVIVEKAGLRIAIVGYIPDYRKSIMFEKIAPYTIDPDMDWLDALMRKIRDEENPDALIILAHADPDVVAEAADPSIVDLVAGGHSHKIKADWASNGIPYIQGYYYANGFASAVLVIAPNGEVTVEDVQYTSITDNKELLYATEENAAHLDPEIMEISYATWTAVQEEMSEVLGYTDTPIQKVKTLGACSAGNWITGLMLRATQADGAIMAFYNVGGIRTSLTIPEGQTVRDVTVYDMYTITPFANSLLVYDINGQELATLLQQGLNQPNYGDQMSGLTFTYTATGDSDTPRAEREFTIISITLDDGTEVDINDTETLYRVCTSNYNATMPGSVFEGKEPVIPLADAPIDNDEFIRLLRAEKEANGGYITVDTGTRGVFLNSEAVAERREVAAEAANYPDFEPFYRIDRDNINEWQEGLDNVRLLSEGRYEYQELDNKYGVDTAFVPSGDGLDTLNISGSAQFSEGQFRELAETLRECAGGDPIYVIDCRSESHALINGIAISYYELHNWGNPGMTLEEVEANEKERFSGMIGSEQTFYEKSGEKPGAPMTLQVESWMTEQELVESEGFRYLRLPALNNHWPAAALIDEFIEFVKGLDMEHVWLHFHCQAGKGRTVTFMCFYDMMKNPDVSLEDIVTRQAMTGGNYLLYTEQSDSYKAPLYDEIAENIRLFYEYVQENHESNYALSWGEWLAEQSIGLAA